MLEIVQAVPHCVQRKGAAVPQLWFSAVCHPFVPWVLGEMWVAAAKSVLLETPTCTWKARTTTEKTQKAKQRATMQWCHCNMEGFNILWRCAGRFDNHDNARRLQRGCCRVQGRHHQIWAHVFSISIKLCFSREKACQDVAHVQWVSRVQ